MDNKTSESLDTNLDFNLGYIRSRFIHSEDVTVRKLTMANTQQRVAILYIPEITDVMRLEQSCIRPLVERYDQTALLAHDDLPNILSILSINSTQTVEDIVVSITSGNAVILLDGSAQGSTLNTAKWEHRTIEKSENESSLRGSLQAFNENIQTNMGLIRQFLKGHELKIEKYECGALTKTPVYILYLEKMESCLPLQTARQRLQAIQVDSVLDSGYIEQLIRDHPRSPFPLMGQSERPDRIAAQLISGRIVIAVDHSPIMLTLPAKFMESFQVPEDYYGEYLIQSSVRILRYIAFWLSLILPSIYLILLTYNPELLATPLLLKITKARQAVPMPTILEILVMALLFEVLYEAGLRLPRPVGPAVSIVGGLVLGEASVSAGMVSASTVIVVALTGILSFIIPGYAISQTFRLLRFPLLIMTGLLGIIGFVTTILLIVLHMFSLTSFGESYMQVPMSLRTRLYQDGIMRAPLDKLTKRSKY